MSLLGTIAYKKSELSYINEQREALEAEIAELEEKLAREKINNPVACLNPEMLICGECSTCHFTNGCSYRFKFDWKKFKL